MPPGASDTRDNMFALLADSPPGKRPKLSSKQTYTHFPDLTPVPKENPKYIVISSADANKKISDISCFMVYKAIQSVSKEIISISELRDGNLLLLVKNQKIATRFINTTNLPNIGHIKCKYHDSLNSTKGSIYAPYLNKVPESEIVSELSDQHVTSVYKFTKNIDGKQVPSGVVLLSFNLYNLPSKIDVSWHSVRVKEYFPNPMRCKTCQLLGHTKKWCKNNPSCVNCNLPPHAPQECTRTMCANCHEPHPSSSYQCKVFQQQKDILKIKTQKKCSLKNARQIYKDQNTPSSHSTSYALALKNAEMPTTSSSNMQNNNNDANNKKTSINNNSKNNKNDNNTCLTSHNGSPSSNILKPDNKIANNNNNKQLQKTTALSFTPTTSNEIANELDKSINNNKQQITITTNETIYSNESNKSTNKIHTKNLKNPNTTPTVSSSRNNLTSPTDVEMTPITKSSITTKKSSVTFDVDISELTQAELVNKHKPHSYNLRSAEEKTTSQNLFYN